MTELLKIAFLPAAFLLMPVVHSQNLITNGSFEEYTQCPDMVDQLERATGWFKNNESPDYFNACAGYLVDVPANFPGRQEPKTGNAYAGIVTKVTGSPLSINFREYLSQELATPMVVGEVYYVSVYVSRADSIYADTTELNVGMATNRLGIRFSVAPFGLQYNLPADNFAHVYSDVIITEEEEWVQISGTFVADQAYTYVHIGNFFDDNNTQTIDIPNAPIARRTAYYYVDDVCVATDSLACTFTGGHPTTGLNEGSNAPVIQLYPNPAEEEIRVSNLVAPRSYRLVTLTGQEFKTGIVTPANNRIDLEGLQNGSYLLVLDEETLSIVVGR